MAKYELALRNATTRINKGFMTTIAQDFLSTTTKINPLSILSERQQNIIDNIFIKWFNRSFTQTSKKVQWCIVPSDAIPGMYASYCFGEEAILISDVIMDDCNDIIASLFVHELVHHMQFVYRGLDLKTIIDGYYGCIEGNQTGDYTKYMTSLEVEAWMIQKEVMEAFGSHPDTIDSINRMLSFAK